MARKESKKLSWTCKLFDCNRQVIIDYNVLKYREDQIKKFKKQCATKEEFTEKLRREFQWQYWSRCEYELIIDIDENNRIWLKPWVGCYDEDKAKIDVTDDDSFDWKGFAVEHIGKQIYKNAAKVDVFDQLMYGDQFEKLVDMCWYTKLPYERDHEKFHRETEENA